MHEASELKSISLEYQALRILLRALEKHDRDLPELILEQQSILAGKLICLPASSGGELGHKATVLLDWVEPEDVARALTVSLCHDTVRLFPPGGRLLAELGAVWGDVTQLPASPSQEEVMKLARHFVKFM